MKQFLAIALLVALPAAGQRYSPFEPGDPYIPDPYGSRLPDPLRHRNPGRQNYVPNSYYTGARTHHSYYPSYSGYNQPYQYQTYDADRAFRFRLLELQAARLAAVDAMLTDAAAISQVQSNHGAARQALREEVKRRNERTLVYSSAWPAFARAWQEQIPPLMDVVAEFSDTRGYEGNRAHCSAFREQMRNVALPPTPAADFTLERLARSLINLQSSCEAGHGFSLMSSISESRAAYVDVAGRVYWRTLLYEELDETPE